MMSQPKPDFCKLPDLVLEKIILYSDSEKWGYNRTLKHLSECNTFLRDYIAENPRLMKRLILKISIDCDGSLTEEDRKRLKACLNSNRRYTSMCVTVQHFDNSDSEAENSDKENELADETSEESEFVSSEDVSEDSMEEESSESESDESMEENSDSESTENDSESIDLDSLYSSDEEKTNTAISVESAKNKITATAVEENIEEVLEPEDFNVAELFLKHSSTIKEIKFKSNTRYLPSECGLEALKYLELLPHLESIAVNFELPMPEDQDIYDIHEECWINKGYCLCSNAWLEVKSKYRRRKAVPENILFANQFEYLKKLRLTTECATVFHVFENCKKLEILELKFGIADIDLTKLFSILRNSRETLKSVTLETDLDYPSNVMMIEDLFVEMEKTEVDLKYFELKMPLMRFQRIHLLLNFLKSQKNLENFQYRAMIDSKLLSKFGEILEELKHLKIVNFGFSLNVLRNSKEYHIRHPWNFGNLEEFTVGNWSDADYRIPKKMLQLPSDKLKKLHFKGQILWTDKNIFRNITSNYQNLVELKVSDEYNKYYCKYTSNDIFMILKFLKKLKVLKFIFPAKHKLNPDLFQNNGDLNLPEIQEVKLEFNDSMSIETATTLIQLMSNTKSFVFFKKWKKYSSEFVLNVVRELPNLTWLYFPDCDRRRGNKKFWKKVESNVLEYNRHPHLLEIFGKKIEYWFKMEPWQRKLLRSLKEAKDNAKTEIK